MSGWLLGIDGGGTHTRAAVCGTDGRLLGVGVSGPSNIDDVGVENAQTNLDQAVAAASAQAGVDRSACQAAFLGMAGVVSAEDRAHIRAITTRLALAPVDRIGIHHDCRIALAGGLEGRRGIVLIVGTGSSCYGVNAAGDDWMAGGRGHLIADEGSGYWLGIEAMRAAVMAYDGRRQATRLLPLVLSRLEIASIDEILHRLYIVGMSRTEVAALAPAVIAAAAEGDSTAQQIIHRGMQDLADCVYAVAVKLNMLDATCEVCAVGGLLQAGPFINDPLHRAIKQRLSNCQIREVALPPVLGAVILALQLANISIEPSILQQLRAARDRI